MPLAVRHLQGPVGAGEADADGGGVFAVPGNRESSGRVFAQNDGGGFGNVRAFEAAVVNVFLTEELVELRARGRGGDGPNALTGNDQPVVALREACRNEQY